MYTSFVAGDGRVVDPEVPLYAWFAAMYVLPIGGYDT
jgi:hypothetical protein